MIREALAFTRRGDGVKRRFLVGGVLSLLLLGPMLVTGGLGRPGEALVVDLATDATSLLFVVGAVFLGAYLLRVIRTAARAVETAPGFGTPRTAVREGVEFLAVVVVYHVPALIAFGVVLAAVLTLFDEGHLLRSIGVMGAVLLITLLAVGYVLLPALLSMSLGDGLRDAFSVGRIRAITTSRIYVRAAARSIPLLAVPGLYLLLQCVILAERVAFVLGVETTGLAIDLVAGLSDPLLVVAAAIGVITLFPGAVAGAYVLATGCREAAAAAAE